MSCIGQPLAMRIIVLRCFVLVRFTNKMFEWASYYDNKKKKWRRAHRSKEEQKGQDSKVESKDKKDKKQLASVQNLYQASPNEWQKMLLCVDFLAAVMSLDRTQERKDHHKSKVSLHAVRHWSFKENGEARHSGTLFNLQPSTGWVKIEKWPPVAPYVDQLPP